MASHKVKKWTNEAYWFLGKFDLLYVLFAIILVVDCVVCCLPKGVRPTNAMFDAMVIAVTLAFAIASFCCLCGAAISLMVASRFTSRPR
jgi:putative Mn2+ efflux pump MntP